MRVLIDTNILVRSVQKAHPLMRTARNALRLLYERGDELYVSPQVVGEFWNVCTRPVAQNGLGNAISATDRLTARIETFFPVLPDSPETFNAWRRLLVEYEVKGAKVHDARIVASMLAHAVTGLLTFNVSDFKRYPGLILLHPEEISQS
jgi:predicted nucleic acid-binding protein